MNKITNKLIVYIITIVTLGMLSLAIYNSYKTKHTLETKTIEQQRNQIQIYTENILNQVDLLESDLAFLANAPMIRRGAFLKLKSPSPGLLKSFNKENTALQMLRDLLNRKANYTRVELIGLKHHNSDIRLRKNYIDHSIYAENTLPLNGLYDPYKKVKMLNRNQVNLSQFKVDNDFVTLTAQTPLVNENGEKIGIFSITMDFSKILSSLNIKNSQIYDFFIFNNQNQLLSTNFNKKGIIAFNNTHELNSLFKEGEDTAMSSTHLFLRQPLYFSKYNLNNAIQILLVTKRSHFDQFIIDKIIDDLVAFAIILSISLVISFHYIKSITKPLRILKKLSHKLSYTKGSSNIINLDQIEIEDLDNDHEITQLTKGLLMMSRHIVSQNKQLELQQKALDLVSLVATTDKDGVIFNVNQKYCDASGYTKSELLGTQLKFLNPHIYSEEFVTKLKNTILSGNIWVGEVKNKSKSGETYWTHTSIVPLVDEDNFVQKVITMSTDTTEQRKKDAELKELTKTKERFLATMSHEIRTPLNAIIGMLSILEEESFSMEGKRNLEILKNNSKSLLVLINDILDLSKIQSGKIQLDYRNTDLSSLINESIELFKGNCDDKNIKIHYDKEFLYPSLISDDTRIRQVISNLISNAIKFSDGNDIEIHQSYKELPNQKIEVSIAIQDHGIGIAPENIGKLFQNFTQADNSTSRNYGGTGLGLAISKEISHALRGDIKVESEIGQGSTFTFSFISETLFESLEAESLTSPFDPNSLDYIRVLIVDDIDINRSIAQKFLAKFNIKSDMAKDGLDAFEKINRSHYDLVFMDSHMPNLDGIGATKKIRNEADYQPWIVAFTAATNEKDDCLSAGMDDFLAKPISKKHLIEVLERFNNSLANKFGQSA